VDKSPKSLPKVNLKQALKYQNCQTPVVSLSYKEMRIPMTELAFENVTKLKCLECGDKLTPWENTLCIICAPDEFELDEEWN
jgi:hypothetical protein